MNITVWPFLVSRNKTHEYRTIVAPSFLQDADASGFLAEASGGDVTEPGFAIYCEVHGLNSGDITPVFHIMLAREQHLGLKTMKLLRDQIDRPIYLTEGFVLKGRRTDIHVTSDIFDSVHRHLEYVYKLFWESADGDFRVHLSRHLDLNVTDEESKHLQVKTRSPFQVLSYPLPDPIKPNENEPTDSSQTGDVFQDNKQLIWIGVGGGLVAAVTALVILLSKWR